MNCMIRKLTISMITAIVIWFTCISGSYAFTCPPSNTIVADPHGLFTAYLAPGWHSSPVLPVDLNETNFYLFYADPYSVMCIYDTPSGYLTLRPNFLIKIDFPLMMNSNYWYCRPEPAENSPLGVSTFCVCNESLDACSFGLL